VDLEAWRSPFQSTIDVAGFVLFLIVFPIYHALYPFLTRLNPERSTKTTIDLYRRSWIERVIERRDVVAAAQVTRNLTMVNTLLASSALILLGFTANVLIQLPRGLVNVPEAISAGGNDAILAGKLYLLILVFAVAFAYCMTALRHLGHFNIVVGADPKVVEEHDGSAVDYLSALISRASNRYTLAVRTFYSSMPLFLWLFDSWLFVALTLFWAAKFMLLQDFRFQRERRG
jgi:uncharacterized membrane protein